MMIKGSCIIRLAGAKYIEYQELRNIAWRDGGGGRGERGRKDNFTVKQRLQKTNFVNYSKKLNLKTST